MEQLLAHFREERGGRTMSEEDAEGLRVLRPSPMLGGDSCYLSLHIGVFILHPIFHFSFFTS